MRTLLEYGLANAAAATALAVLALLVGLFVRRPAVRNAMWVLVFVRLLLPPVWTVSIPALDAEPEVSEVVATIPVVATESESDLPVFVGNPLTGPHEEVEPDTINSVAEAAPITAAPEPTSDLAIPLEVYFVIAWLAGSLFVFGRSVRRIVRFRLALRDARPAPPEIRRQAEALSQAMGLRRCPQVLLVPGRVWPSLWMPSLFARQAKLILPTGLLPLLDPGQREAVIAHELAHLRRGDPWVRWLELIVCGIYWWHPLLGWFRRKLRESEEECCDMWVVDALCGRRSYATALVETAMYLNGPESASSPALASGAGPVRNLQRRVTMIMRATWPARLTRLGLATVLGIGSLGLAFGPALAQDRKEKDRPREEERPKERPREDERPKDRPREEPPKERVRERPGDPAPRERGDDKTIQQAREALEKARKEVQEAMARLHEAESKLARAEGRPVPPMGRGDFVPGRGPGGDRGQGERGPGDRGPGDRGPGDRGPGDRVNPPRGPGGGDLQQQIEELRRALEEMRRDMRRGNEGRPDGPGRRDEGPAPKRPGTPEVPKRPVERER
jgi:beta-lactamase regulating signal transducer with metallopeptidase domain